MDYSRRSSRNKNPTPENRHLRQRTNRLGPRAGALSKTGNEIQLVSHGQIKNPITLRQQHSQIAGLA